MARLALLGTLLAILVCGCSATDTLGERSQVCIGEPTQPITSSELRQALRQYGFTVLTETGAAAVICDLPPRQRMPIAFSNIIFEGPDENTKQHRQISKREGHYYCGLRRGPIWGTELNEDLDAPPASPIFGGDKAEFKFANLECTIYPEGDRKGEQVRNLQQVVRDLVSAVEQRS
jgi:hypothetical protein